MKTLMKALLRGLAIAYIAIVSLLIAVVFWKQLLILYVVFWIISLLMIIGLFFGARWALKKEWEKESKPSFLREGIIFFASWLWVAFCFIIGTFNNKLEVSHGNMGKVKN